MAGDYTDASTAVKNALISAFPDDLNDENVQDGKLDKIITYLNTVPGARMGCYLSYLRSEQTSTRPFQTYIWDDSILCTILLRVEDVDIVEEDTHTIINTLRRLFLSDRRLGGAVNIATITLIDKPVQAKIGEEPFQWIPFIVAVKSQEIR